MKKFYTLLSTLLTILALATVSTASFWVLIYQPKTPKCLLK